MFITIGNTKIYSASFGSTALPVIMGIGGWIGSWELWAEPFSILSQNWHTISYDHRGAGASIAPIETITFDWLVDDVFAVRREIPFASPVKVRSDLADIRQPLFFA